MEAKQVHEAMEKAKGMSNRAEEMRVRVAAHIGDSSAQLLTEYLIGEKIVSTMMKITLKGIDNPLMRSLVEANLTDFAERRMIGALEQMRFRMDRDNVPNEKRLAALADIVSVLMDEDPAVCQKVIDSQEVDAAGQKDFMDFNVLFRSN